MRIMLWQRYSKNKLKAIHNTYCYVIYTLPAVAKVFKEQIESNSQHEDSTDGFDSSCGKGIQRTN